MLYDITDKVSNVFTVYYYYINSINDIDFGFLPQSLAPTSRLMSNGQLAKPTLPGLAVSTCKVRLY